jgi:SAM-dependent methyltransferase
MGLPLDGADEPNRYPIQLYHLTATQAGGLAGKRVLEVGCGHGGGASYLTRALGPQSYVGLDLNPAGIEFCRQCHQVPGLQFVRGDAEDLPFPAGSFDAVINVESSHGYPHVDRFLSEVARVLRPGGVLLYADVWQWYGCAQWEAAMANAALRVVSWRDIGGEVQRGIERNWAQIAAVMEASAVFWPVPDALVPRFMRRRALAPVRESPAYRRLDSGQLSYRMYCLAKAT